MSEAAARVPAPTARRSRTRRSGVQPEAGAPKAEADGRQRLIQQALILFADKGFDGVTVRDLAAASGVSVGLINHHFGSKEGLREAVDQYFLAQFQEALTISSTTNLRTMEDFAAWVDEWINRHRDHWDATVGYFRRALLEDSEWGGNLFTRFYAIVQNSIMQMDARGEIRPEVDRLWLPFLVMYMELGTLLLNPHVTRVLGRSGFDGDLWRRRHRAYMDLLRHGASPR
jgi:TetR/AcrR family transcriptional regulator, regulator of cefoperazone and chloramphenicol sensitivity